VGVKLPDGTAHTAARGLPGASDWAPHGSPMSGWVLLPPDLLDDRDAVQQWVVRAYDLVRAAPADAPPAGRETGTDEPSQGEDGRPQAHRAGHQGPPVRPQAAGLTSTRPVPP